MIEDGIRQIPVSSSTSESVNITKNKVLTAFSTLTKGKDIKALSDSIQDHFNELSPSIALCSSPKGFRTAWGLRSKTLSMQDAEAIVNDGGQLIPVNDNSRLLSCEQQGVVLGPEKKLVLAVRHSEGNYEDSLDELGRFTYQPPRDVSGMLRYRWCQFLSQKLKVPYVVLVIMWFEYRLNNKMNQLFILAPAKIIDCDEDLINLNESVHRPLKLQLIPRHEAFATLNLIKSLNSDNIDIDVRAELPEALAREWSYDKINSTEKGKQLKRWAQRNSISCPGSKCDHIPFRELKNSDIAFGHIVSQNWSSAFTFMLDKVHHPDNLYLTCKTCNSSLSNNFPEPKLREQIVKQGTIGDWLRLHEHKIREAK
ncbi:hypothetical protein [Polynucleobacter sp. MWH-HuK1]|uniref:hypothetical protein n=1 Tax=Polynucleobacter sp. MWH-HuK1 TaxID=1743158 RepID=UPI001C0ABF0F|nr:hypothetical protein [Polynucleobacter sp. MWH-HuK1]MBU3565992.1 hypothetical protein [Polynucleobacter sp. MWH-HuK1]